MPTKRYAQSCPPSYRKPNRKKTKNIIVPTVSGATRGDSVQKTIDKAAELKLLSDKSLLYEPLDSSKHEIRLLRIVSSLDKTAVHCRLQTTSLDAQPRYQALSYEWNPPDVNDSSVKVLVNGQEMQTTATLRNALVHLNGGPKRFYWVDAICINQSNNEERGHQVQLMRIIYQQAERVIVWLGLDHADLSLAGELVAGIANDPAYVGADLEAEKQILAQKVMDPLLARHWRSAIQLFDSSYWSRLWIVQEIVVAKQIIVLCGSTSISWKDIMELYRYNQVTMTMQMPDQDKESVLPLEKTRSLNVNSILVHRIKWNRSQDYTLKFDYDIDLLGNLMNYDEQVCQDPRDRVYAILGISEQTPTELEFPISYTEPASKVYFNAAKFIIESTGNLDILGACERDPEMPGARPSWVPDWENYKWSKMPVTSTVPEWWAWQKEARESFWVDGRTLRVRGFIIGTLMDISGHLEVSEPEVTAISIRGWLRFAAFALHQSSTVRDSLLAQSDSFAERTIPQNETGEAGKHANQEVAWDATIEVLYDALLRTCIRSQFYENKFPLSLFRKHCEALQDDNAGQVRSEGFFWEVINLFDPNVFRVKRLCSIQISSTDMLQAPHQGLNDSQSRTVGCCPSNAKKCDIVAAIHGCWIPLLLRRVEDGYIVINSAYAYGFMKGEAAERFPEIDINLV